MARNRPIVNKAALAARRQQVKSEVGTRGDYFNPKEPGEYLFYLGWQTYSQDDFPFLEVWVHYGLKGVPLTTCLDLEKNDILNDDRVHKFLKNGAEDVQGPCPGCAYRETLTTPEAKRDVARKRRFPMNIVLMATRPDVSSEWDMVKEAEQKVQPFSPGYGVWSDITDIILNEGDICDPDGAILIRLVRVGKGKNSTEYTVTAESNSIRNPVKLSSALQTALDEALVAGESGDLYRRIAVDMHKTRKVVEDAMAGKKVKTSDSAADDDDGKPPKCFRMDYTDDDDCAACPWRGPCSDHLAKHGEGPYGDGGPLKAGEMFEGHDLKEGDKGFDPDADDDTDDDTDDDEETEEEEAARLAAEKKAASAAKRKANRAKKKAAAKAAEEAAAGDDDEEEDDTDAILEGLGYDDGQLGRMTDDTAFFLADHAVPADAVSVGKTGGYTLFAQKLPTDHAMYEAPEEEPEPEPAPRRRRRSRKSAEETKAPAPKGDDDDDGDDGDPLGLDDLERELKNAAKR